MKVARTVLVGGKGRDDLIGALPIDMADTQAGKADGNHPQP